MAGIKKFIVAGILGLITTTSIGQMTSGRIVYERKTNLKKLFKDNDRVNRFLGDDVKSKIEEFELLFDDSLSAFKPIEGDEVEQGFMRFLTSHNTVYRNTNKNEKTLILDMWGTTTYVQDSITERQWKVTDSKRRIAGYLCRKAMWEMNDTTRIYAWFSADLIPSVGPEGFGGLPGTILGLANEEGTIIYFAKEITLMKPTEQQLTFEGQGKEIFTQEALKKTVQEKMGQWLKEGDLEGMFSWL